MPKPAITDAFLLEKSVEQMVAATMHSSGFTIGGTRMMIWLAITSMLLRRLLIQSGQLALKIISTGSARHRNDRLVMNDGNDVTTPESSLLKYSKILQKGSLLSLYICEMFLAWQVTQPQ